MYPYNNKNYNGMNPYGNGDRFFIAPFLLGAFTGGAAVAITNPYRPRPYYPAYPPYYPPRPYPYY